MSMPRARQVDSMILKQHWMVGSWLHSSSSRWYDSSRLPTEPAAGDHTDDEKDASDPLLLFAYELPGRWAGPEAPMARCVKRLICFLGQWAWTLTKI